MQPDGHFGPFGGRYVPDTLMAALSELEAAWGAAKRSAAFWKEFRHYTENYAGRPTPLFLAERWSRRIGRPRIYLKREDLNHTGSHKLNNCIGQILLARRLGKKRIIAETGAGQHGVATATVCALFGLECVVYMGAEDVRRQALNVTRMDILGARVVPVTSGSGTLKDSINEAIRDWVTHVDTTHYVIGSVVGPDPYPTMVRDFQCIIGREVRKQLGRAPDAIVACVGGGSNAIGIFHPFLRDRRTKLWGVEAAGHGIGTQAHSVAAGLDYPGVGPEHAWLKDAGRVTYTHVDDEAAVRAFRQLSREEGIIPALESAHAVAFAEKLSRKMKKGQALVVNISGRGDKDVGIIQELGGK